MAKSKTNQAGQQAAARAARKRTRAAQAARHQANRRQGERALRRGPVPFRVQLQHAIAGCPPPGLAPCYAPLRAILGGRLDPTRRRMFITLLHHLRRRAPRVLIPEHIDPLFHMTVSEWLRPLDAWRPRGKSPDTQLRSLAGYLLTRYPMPKFLYSSFFETEPDHCAAQVALFVYLGGGGSPYKAVKRGLLPARMTRRMCHRFMTVSGVRSIVEAARVAQVEALGGDARLAKAICASPLGRAFNAREDFWLSAITWFCNQGMLSPGQVGPLVDYILHRLREDEGFAMKGRGALALLRQMDEWHGHLRRVRALKGQLYEPSGFAGGRYLFKRKKGPDDIWTVTEITCSKSLAAEGRAMKHCVYSYGRWISAKRTSIWSLRLNDERRLTIEVQNAFKRVVQVRGPCNRMAKEIEARALARWATEAGLSVASGQLG